MAPGRRVVFSRQVHPGRLPDWASEGTILIEWLQQQGLWQEAGERLQIARQGGYCGWDGLLFLLYFFTCGLPIGLKEFGARAHRYRQLLAAVGGRKTLPSPSALSRLLSAVRPEDLRDFGPWLLLQAPDVTRVLQHPSVLTRDAQGAGWHVFDWDPTVTTLRHRALPVADDLPVARRRSAAMAQPGYPGRKRGDVQFSRATLQHAGSGLWIGIHLAPGNGHAREAFEAALPLVATTCQLAGTGVDRALIRCDGVAGNVPFITACGEAHVHYVTRLARYGVLEQPEIMRQLREVTWYQVADSGSGPSRHACELGTVVLAPDEDTRRRDGSPYAPVRARLVASRFATDQERGTGVTINGWHYELYATDLEAAAWPCTHVVTGYYGRTAEENRLAQEDREYGLDRIFSYHLPGQELATLVGLFVWNYHVARGFMLADPPPQLPAQTVVEPVPLPPDPARTEGAPGPTVALAPPPTPSVPPLPAAAPEPAPAPRAQAAAPPEPGALPPAAAGDAAATTTRTPVATDPTTHATASPLAAPPRTERATGPGALVAAIDSLPWSTMLGDDPHTGWTWDGRALGLRCPADQVLPLIRVEQVRGRGPRVRFQAPGGTCDGCALRSTCLRSADPTYRKDVRLPVPQQYVPGVEQAWEAYRRAHPARRGGISKEHVRQTYQAPDPLRPAKPVAWDPPAQVAPAAASLALAAPLLLPAVLRRLSRSVGAATEVSIDLLLLPDSPPRPLGLAFTDGERQHRRLTWAQRHQWNALPHGAHVTLRFARADGPIPLLACTDEARQEAA